MCATLRVIASCQSMAPEACCSQVRLKDDKVRLPQFTKRKRKASRQTLEIEMTRPHPATPFSSVGQGSPAGRKSSAERNLGIRDRTIKYESVVYGYASGVPPWEEESFLRHYSRSALSRLRGTRLLDRSLHPMPAFPLLCLPHV